jgi:hypothetical protein
MREDPVTSYEMSSAVGFCEPWRLVVYLLIAAYYLSALHKTNLDSLANYAPSWARVWAMATGKEAKVRSQ